MGRNGAPEAPLGDAMKRTRYPLTLVAALSITLGFGCDQKGDETAAGSGTQQKSGSVTPQAKGGDKGATPKAPTKVEAPASFAAIPADTPYVIAAFEPLPREVTDKLGTALAPLIQELEADIEREIGQATGDSTDDKLARALWDELKGNLNRAGMEKLGISTEPRFALYGIGVLPAFRIELKDPAALKAAIERVQTKAGVKAPVQKLGEQEYWGIDDDGMSFAIAIVGNELVAGVVPQTAKDALLPVLFGQKKPEKSLMDGGALTTVAQQHGFKPYLLGLVDVDGIARTILGQGKGINAQVWTALGSPVPALSETCQTEILGLVANAPRMVMGYTEITTKHWGAKYVIETKPELAAALKGLTTPVPGVGERQDALFAFGAGVDIQKAIEFAKTKVAAIKAAPYKCEELAGLNEAVGEMEQGLNQPLPPFVTNIKGFNVVVKDGDFSKGQPQAIKGFALVRVDQPEQLLAMAKGMAPPLASLEVPKDGKPVAFPAGIIPPVVDEPHIAMNDKAIAVSVGQGESAGLTGVLSAKSPADAPLLAISYDMKKFMALMSAQMQQQMAFLPPEMQAEKKKEAELMKSLGNSLGDVGYAVQLTDKGIVLMQDMYFE